MSLLSSSPLLASLFVSYANQVATLESVVVTPSPESEEWKALQEFNASQLDDIKFLQAELVEAKEKYARLTVESNTEKAALQIQISDLEVCLNSCLITD